MFGIGFPELLFIMVLALILFGPDKLPEIASALGKFMGEMKKTSDSVRREFYNSVYSPVEDARQQLRSEMRQLTSEKPAAPAAPQNEASEGLPNAKSPEQQASVETPPPAETPNPLPEPKDGSEQA